MWSDRLVLLIMSSFHSVCAVTRQYLSRRPSSAVMAVLVPVTLGLKVVGALFPGTLSDGNRNTTMSLKKTLQLHSTRP